MERLLILAEKPDAKENFAKALGGETGILNGNPYQLVSSKGHIFEFKRPEEMVDPSKVSKYADWKSPEYWKYEDFHWTKTLKPGRYKVFKAIKDAAKNKDAVVIATDDDESGEGDLIGWEIVNALKWKKKVYRCRFSEETPKYLVKALNNLEDVTDQWSQGTFLESTARSQFDFLSMDLSRKAKDIAEKVGYTPKSIRIGRLKSGILQVIYDMQKKRDAYVKKPYYEVRFADSNGHIFKRKFEEKTSNFRYSSPSLANRELSEFRTSSITIDSTVEKSEEPPNLIDLSTISVILGKQGFKDKQINDTYQAMYQKEHWLSYPRPGDTKITQGLFDELLPLVDRIADVVGVNKNLLTHRVARSKYLAQRVDHGANRPGLVVPPSLETIKQKYGVLGVALYTLVAKAYLAILCEDYVYIKQKAHLTQYPEFTASIVAPKEMNYKLLYDPESEKVKRPKIFSEIANPYIYEGANIKPPDPSKAAVVRFLKKNKIGTNATISPTLADISEGDRPLISNKKGIYSFTYEGRIQALLSNNSMISNAHTTHQLQKAMKYVLDGKMDYRKIPISMETIEAHDVPVFKNNIRTLASDPYLKALAKKHKPPQKYEPKDKVKGVWHGKEIEINTIWGSHSFSQKELNDLFAGKEISFQATSKRGAQYTAKGKIQRQTFNKKSYYGFKLNKK